MNFNQQKFLKYNILLQQKDYNDHRKYLHYKCNVQIIFVATVK